MAKFRKLGGKASLTEKDIDWKDIDWENSMAEAGDTSAQAKFFDAC